MATDISRWVHTDPRGLDAAIGAAMTRAMQLDSSGEPNGWPLSSDADYRTRAAADLRALLVASAAAWNLSSSKPPVTTDIASAGDLGLGLAGLGLPGGAQAILLSSRSPSDFAAIDSSIFDGGIAVLSAWVALATRNAQQTGDDLSKWKLRGFTTVGGANPIALTTAPEPVSAAFPALAAVAIVTGAAALAYIAAKALDVYDRNLARESDSKRMVGLTSAATTVLANHAQVDASSGKSTPLSPSEQQVIAQLVEATKRYAVPEVNPLDKDAKGSLFAGLGTVGVLAVLAVITFFALKKG